MRCHMVACNHTFWWHTCGCMSRWLVDTQTHLEDSGISRGWIRGKVNLWSGWISWETLHRCWQIVNSEFVLICMLIRVITIHTTHTLIWPSWPPPALWPSSHKNTHHNTAELVCCFCLYRVFFCNKPWSGLRPVSWLLPCSIWLRHPGVAG